MNPGLPVDGFLVETYGVNPVRPLDGVDCTTETVVFIVCIETGVSDGEGVVFIDTGVSAMLGVVGIAPGVVSSGPGVSDFIVSGVVSLGTGPGIVVGGFPQIHLPHPEGVVFGLVIRLGTVVKLPEGLGVVSIADCGADAFGVVNIVVSGTIVVLVSLCGTEPSFIVDIKAPVVPSIGTVVPAIGPLVPAIGPVVSAIGPVVPGGVSFVVPITRVVDFGSKYGKYPVAWGVVDFVSKYGKYPVAAAVVVLTSL